MAKTYYGFNPPFFGGQQNVLSRQSGDRLIKNDLLQLIRTSPGERVMRPTWGTFLNRSVFEQLDNTTIDNVRTSILNAIRHYEPRVNVDVDVIVNEDSNMLKVRISGVFTNQENTTFYMELELPTGGV